MPRTTKKPTTPIEKHPIPTVPVAEQPYQVPENWQWVRLGDVSSNQYGYTAKAIFDDSYPKMLRITDIHETGVDWLQVPNCQIDDYNLNKYLLHENDIVIARTGATTGKSFLVKNPYSSVFASYLIRLRVNSGFNPEYIYYYLQTELYWKQISELSSGIAQPGVNSSKLQTMPIPLPPLAEQQRIVDRIERLFAKLDEAREKAQAVVDGFENRKAAILHQAFTGELTRKWREERGIGMESWTSVIMNSVLDVRDGTHDSPKYFDIGYPLVTSKNLKNGMIIDKDIKYISKDDYDKINERSKVDKGDILFAMIGTIGNPVVVEDEPVYAIKNVALFKNIGKINPYFVRYYLESKTVIDKMEREAKGSTQKFVSLGYLRNFIISKPSDLEQNKVVQLINHLLTSEHRARDLAESVIAQIDGMKKAILARAFRGELGTNDPSEAACEV